jgi:hypothetical protein
MWFLATAAVLALVIAGAAAFWPQGEDDTEDVALEDTAQADLSEKFYEQAMEALESGETTEAAELLRKAIEADPDNERARDELARVTDTLQGGSSGGGSSSGGDGGSDGGTDDGTDGGADGGSDGDGDGTDPPPIPDPDEGWDVPVEDLATLLPAEIPGYDRGAVLVSGDNATVFYDPTFEGPFDYVRRQLTTVNYMGDTASADGFVENGSKVAYPDDSETVMVEGVEAYFGTDGTRLATVVFTRGHYVFEVILTVERGAPVDMKDYAVEVAEQFPDSL